MSPFAAIRSQIAWDARIVPRLRRAHDVVGAGVQHLAHRLEFGRDAIDELLRRYAFARGRLLHLEAMLVHAGDEQTSRARRGA